MNADFAQKLKSYLNQLAEAKERRAHHDHLRHLFLAFLNSAFTGLHMEEVELESQIKALRVRGFIDVLVKDIIFEFKRDLTIERPKGQEELKRYLESQPEPERLFGILTDGQAFEIYTLRAGKLTPVETITLDAGKPDEAYLSFDCYLFADKHIPPTTRDIIHRFGEKSAVFATTFTTISKLLVRVRKHASVETKVSEWGRLLAHVYGSDIADDRLFLRHTYLAIFARLLAFAAIKNKVPSDQELAGVIDGKAFEGLGIQNLVEEDFFTWILERRIANETLSLLRGLAAYLRVYDLSRLNEDLLKELYQELVDPVTRHDLGEYYTPDWLAELTLRETGFGAGKSLLDPACGSGTFLFTAIRLLKEQGVSGEALVRWAQNELGGLDIHPLAVIIARVNFLLALASELGKGAGPLRIPIYMADTLRAPEVEIQPTIPVEVALSKLPRKLPARRFDLPVPLAEEPGKMERLLDSLREYALMAGAEKDLLAGMSAKVAQEGASEWSWVFENNLRLLRHLVSEDRDTVYIFIMRNTYRQELFSRRKFDMVAGNPPWLSYRYIQQPQYQQRVKKLVRYHSLMDTKSVKLFTQMELATLFFAHCYDRFLKEGSIIAFVMPRSVLTGAKQHARFQAKFTQDKTLDLEGVSPLFNVPACVLIKEKGGSSRPPAFTVITGELPAKNMSLTQARQYLAFSASAQPLTRATSQSRYLDKFFQGATIVPRCFWFVRPSEVLALDPYKPQLETDPDVEAQAKAPWKGIRLSGQVEAEFLYATLLSTDLVPFGYRRLRLVVLPITLGGDGKAKLTDRKEALRQGKDGLARWLEGAEVEWQTKGKGTGRVASPYARLNYDSNLTRQRPQQGYKVLYPGVGTYLASCVISHTELLMPLKVQGFVSTDITYDYETGDGKGAHYLCAMLNAPRIDQAIKPYQTRGTWGPRHIHRRPFEVLPIPLFDAQDARHLRLAEISQACHAKVGAMDLPQKRSIGRLRQEIRALFKTELAEIDALVKDILKA